MKFLQRLSGQVSERTRDLSRTLTKKWERGRGLGTNTLMANPMSHLPWATFLAVAILTNH